MSDWSKMDQIHRQILYSLEKYMKKKHPSLKSPDYIRTKHYSPQWKIIGSVYYYKMPTKKIAVMIDKDYNILTSFDGIPQPLFDAFLRNAGVRIETKGID
ncbi:MAG: hypothetical protein DRQ62_00130 [Gammaproteobacteria bacterium]|nr:MAG: hypothetical protein DRQ62_00130 [Gammaproteobacteria bacterium]